MFGIFGGRKAKVQKTTEFVAERMLLTLGHLRAGPLTEILFGNLLSSPYHSGYIQGKLSSLLAYAVKSGQLPHEDANAVSGLVLMSLFDREQAKLLSNAIKKHAGDNSSQYQAGFDKGSLVGLYMVGARDISKEPNLQEAVETARSASESYNQLFPEDAANMPPDDVMSLAIMGLSVMWFTEPLSSLESE